MYLSPWRSWVQNFTFVKWWTRSEESQQKGRSKCHPPFAKRLSPGWFLDSWDSHIPWRSEKHWVLLVSTDASMSRGIGVIHIQPGERLGKFEKARRLLGSQFGEGKHQCQIDVGCSHGPGVLTNSHKRLSSWRSSWQSVLSPHVNGTWSTFKRVAQRLIQLVPQRNVLLKLS